MKKNLLRGFYVLLSSFMLIMSTTSYIVSNNKKATKLVSNVNYKVTKPNIVVDDDPVDVIDNEIKAESNIKTINVETKEEKEEYIINYFNKVEEKINDITESETAKNIKTKTKVYVVTMVDFLFYDGTIHDVTFDELSDETKAKIYEIAGRIDTKIESKVPGYKETIKDKSGKAITYLSDKLTISKEYVENKIIEKVGEEKYETVKEEVTEKASAAKEKSKEIISSAKDKIKSWYENWR